MTTKNEQDIQSDVVIPDNFVMLPNVAIQELDATSFKLLAIYINTARQNSKCWKANQTVADELGCGIVKMKRARKTLDDMGYITFVPGTSTTRAIVSIRYSDMWKHNSLYRGGGIQNEYPPRVSEMITNKDSLKATKTKDSLPQKNAEVSAPSDAISDASAKKGEDNPESYLKHDSEIDWQAKILEVLTDDWMLASNLEVLLDVPIETFAPLTFSSHPAHDALYMLEAERKVEYEAIPTERKWRLRDDASEIDWQARILDTLTDEWQLYSALEILLGIPIETFDTLTFSAHPAGIALYALEAERKVEYDPHGKGRRWRLHSDYGQGAPKSDSDLLKAAIGRCLKIYNGEADLITHMLRGTAKKGIYGEEAVHFAGYPVSADELEGMADYWVKRNPDINTPRKPRKVSSEMAGFRLYLAQDIVTSQLNFAVSDEVVEGSMEDMQAKNLRLFMQSQEESDDE